MSKKAITIKKLKFKKFEKSIRIIILLSSLTLVTLGYLQLFGDENPKLNRLLYMSGFLIQVIYLFGLYWSSRKKTP